MIRKEDLLSFARLKQLAPRLVELDYLQDVALLNLFREYGNKLIFKGGTCLYKAYQLNRFSEDLDFSTKPGFKAAAALQRLPYFFSLLNLNSTIKIEQFGKAVNVYLKIIGPLYDGSKGSMATLILNISSRERVLFPVQRIPYLPLYLELRPFDLLVMDEREILAEKVRAIYERNKARDVYDLWYLILRKGIVQDQKLIVRKLSAVGLKFTLPSFLSKIQKKEESWKKDLGGLIAGPLPDFKKVEELLTAALFPAAPQVTSVNRQPGVP
ncbi:MAG: nucleotidyl transferase AbiEii/AbiGii toxin family protein [Nanoarchaeota archaeon]